MISDQHEQISIVIAEIYRKVDWKKMTSIKRSAVDVLTDRIRVASKEPDILRAHDKLCASLHIPTSKINTDLIEILYQDNDNTMRILRKHTGYIAALSQKKAKEIKNEN